LSHLDLGRVTFESLLSHFIFSRVTCESLVSHFSFAGVTVDSLWSHFAKRARRSQIVKPILTVTFYPFLLDEIRYVEQCGLII
jgi:hypothetical protein